MEHYLMMKERGNARIEHDPDETVHNIKIILKKPDPQTLDVEEVPVPVNVQTLRADLKGIEENLHRFEAYKADVEALLSDIDELEAEMAAEQEAEEVEDDGEA